MPDWALQAPNELVVAANRVAAARLAVSGRENSALGRSSCRCRSARCTETAQNNMRLHCNLFRQLFDRSNNNIEKRQYYLSPLNNFAQLLRNINDSLFTVCSPSRMMCRTAWIEFLVVTPALRRGAGVPRGLRLQIWSRRRATFGARNVRRASARANRSFTPQAGCSSSCGGWLQSRSGAPQRWRRTAIPN